MSLFQGGGNLELNTSAQHRQEEQEALEDQLRLQREVQTLRTKNIPKSFLKQRQKHNH